MSKLFLIQAVGELEYAHLDKPVRYTPEFYTGLTNQKKITMRDEHSGEIVTEVTGLFYQDGALWASTKDDIDVKNRGFSPIFKDPLVKEYDDYIEPVSAKIKSIDIVDNPRQHETFLYNSSSVVNDKKEGDDLADKDTYEKMGALQLEVDNAKKAERAAKDKFKKKEEEYNNLKTTKDEEYDDLKTKYDDLKSKHNGYVEKEATTLEEKAIALADGDEELEAAYKTMTLEQLKVMEAKKKAKISAKIETKSKELAVDNEDLAKVLNKLPLEDLEIIEKANHDWDKDLAEKYPNDRPFKGAGANQRNGYNKDGTKDKEKKPEDDISTREGYNNVVGKIMPVKRRKFVIG